MTFAANSYNFGHLTNNGKQRVKNKLHLFEKVDN